MEQQTLSPKAAAARFATAVRMLAGSDVGGRAKALFAGLIALLCGVAAMNVLNSYVGRNFMTAIAERQSGTFVRQAVLYVCVFAALTLMSVVARFIEERLALLWRDFLTRRSIKLYLANRTYYRLAISDGLTHPDQRIADDVRAFTVTTLSFVLMIFNSSLTVVSFSGVLWSISPLLFVVAVLYAASGSYLTILLGRPLIGLNYDQLDKEASFRSGLIRVSENAEPLLIARAEANQAAILGGRFDAVVANFQRIIAVNRRVGFFTTGYSWMIQIIPALIVAPFYFRGEVEFGVITQSAAAFAMLVSAFSLIITQFKSISNFVAVVTRLGSLISTIEGLQGRQEGTVEFVEAGDTLRFDAVTLRSPNGAPLWADLELSIPDHSLTLVRGDEATGTALFRAMAGIPVAGGGSVTVPAPGRIALVPQRPYLPAESLRELMQPARDGPPAEGVDVGQLVADLGVEGLVGGNGGLDYGRDWTSGLSAADQVALSVASALLAGTRYVVFDRIELTLSPSQINRILHLLAKRSIGCVLIGNVEPADDLARSELRAGDEGRWSWTPSGPAR